jgi:hypothetical protein
MKRKPIRFRPVVEGSAFRVFDIVNGFLIDAVAHGGRSLVFGPEDGGNAALTDVISG